MPKPELPKTFVAAVPGFRLLDIPDDDMPTPPTPPAQTTPPAAQAPPAARVIRVTAELKQRSEALLAALRACSLDEVEAERVETLRLKHDSAGSAITTAAAMNELLQELHARCVLQTVKANIAANGVTVDVPAELVWNNFWGEALEDAAHTDHEHVEAEAGVIPLALKLAAAFRSEAIVRIELVSDGEAEVGVGWNPVLRQQFDDLRKCQAAYAKALRDAVVPETALRVAVTGENLGGFSVEVNGKPKEFGKKNSPLKALLILALFRRRERFSVEDFAKLYVGKVEAGSLPGKTFSNAIRELKQVVGAFAVEKFTAERSVPGIVFTQAPSDEVLRALIAGLLHRESA